MTKKAITINIDEQEYAEIKEFISEYDMSVNGFALDLIREEMRVTTGWRHLLPVLIEDEVAAMNQELISTEVWDEGIMPILEEKVDGQYYEHVIKPSKMLYLNKKSKVCLIMGYNMLHKILLNSHKKIIAKALSEYFGEDGWRIHIKCEDTLVDIA